MSDLEKSDFANAGLPDPTVESEVESDYAGIATPIVPKRKKSKKGSNKSALQSFLSVVGGGNENDVGEVYDNENDVEEEDGGKKNKHIHRSQGHKYDKNNKKVDHDSKVDIQKSLKSNVKRRGPRKQRKKRRRTDNSKTESHGTAGTGETSEDEELAKGPEMETFYNSASELATDKKIQDPDNTNRKSTRFDVETFLPDAIVPLQDANEKSGSRMRPRESTADSLRFNLGNEGSRLSLKELDSLERRKHQKQELRKGGRFKLLGRISAGFSSLGAFGGGGDFSGRSRKSKAIRKDLAKQLSKQYADVDAFKADLAENSVPEPPIMRIGLKQFQDVELDSDLEKGGNEIQDKTKDGEKHSSAIFPRLSFARMLSGRKISRSSVRSAHSARSEQYHLAERMMPHAPASDSGGPVQAPKMGGVLSPKSTSADYIRFFEADAKAKLAKKERLAKEDAIHQHISFEESKGWKKCCILIVALVLLAAIIFPVVWYKDELFPGTELRNSNTTNSPTSPPVPTESPTSFSTHFPSLAPTKSPTSLAPTSFPTTSAPTFFPTSSAPTSSAPTPFPTTPAPTAFPTASPVSGLSRLSCPALKLLPECSTGIGAGDNWGSKVGGGCADTFAGPDSTKPEQNWWAALSGRKDCVTANYAGVLKRCTDIGARLCSSDELSKGAAVGTGCGADNALVYSGSTCTITGGASGKTMVNYKSKQQVCETNLSGVVSVARCCADGDN